jgi:hypothetical protein
MYRRRLFVLVSLVGLAASMAQAAPITVENSSFELPGTVKQNCWDGGTNGKGTFVDVPGWSSDTLAADSGVETGWTPTDGLWTGFVMSGDPSVWQLTEHVIVSGDVFELKVDSRITSAATALRMTLYYDNDGERVVAATRDAPITGTMAEYSLTFDSTTLPACAGHRIGIEFANPTSGSSWLGLDNVRLELLVQGTSGAALAPVPADGASDLSRDVDLGWKPGPFADTHDIYLGTSFADVNAAGVSNPPGVLLVQGHDSNSYDPGRLELGQTYYWRVDEVNAPSSPGLYKGAVWSFTIEPKSIAVPADQITATASSSSSADTGPEKTIDGSGLDASDQHSTDSGDMWLSSGTEPETWIQYEFARPQVLDKMLVWNSNQSLEILFGFGARDVTVEYSMDGSAWTTLGDFELAQATGSATYTANTTIVFGDVAAKVVKLMIHSNWGGVLPQRSLSEVRFMAIPVAAREPVPGDAAADIDPREPLSWRAGRRAVSHEVYVSTDPNAAADGTVAPVTTTTPSCRTALDLAQTYYWKVVEVNDAEDPAAWSSDVWSFSTAAYLNVDDFEGYTNDSPNRVFQTWIDGYGFSEDEFFPAGNPGNNTGSGVGHDIWAPGTSHYEGSIIETSIVYAGGQSMPFYYDNSSLPTSEATRTWATTQDWTANSVTMLTLHFYGDPNNTGSAPLWIKLTDQSNKTATATFGDGGEDVTALVDLAWTEWNIPLSSFAGVNLAQIKSMTIGVGPGAAAGLIYIDDIRLYPTRDIAVAPAAVLVAHWKLDNNAQDSSGNGNDGTLNGGPTYVAAGRIGAALSVDGIDDYVDCGNGASLNITDTISLSAWIKAVDIANAQHNPFIAKGDTAYAIKHNTNNRLEFFVYNNNAWHTATSAVLNADYNNSWHHVAGTFDGVQLKLYLDGKVVGNNLYTGPIATDTYNVNLGRNSQNTDRLYYGLIDDARIYHGVLTKAEIAALANP